MSTNSDVMPHSLILHPDNHNKKYEVLFQEIDNGSIKLPMFQREFVWEKEQSAKLIDSILKGFPIGTFIFWKTRESLKSFKDVGNHTLPDTPKGDYVQYILDGQQRITSLYAIRKGIRISKDGKVIDYRDIFIDLDHDPEIDEQMVVSEIEDGRNYVSVHDILTLPAGHFYKSMSSEEADVIQNYKAQLTNYDFSTITIRDYPIEIACEVFTRINTGGKALTVFEIMVAKTYDGGRNFDLAVKFEELKNGTDEEKECLASAKFETLKGEIIMQAVATITSRAVKSRDILKINRETFIDNWEPMKKALFTSIDFVRTELRIPLSAFLPYPAILLPIIYFFHQTKNKKPSNRQIRMLEQFYYWVGITERYGSGTESKLTEDFNKIDSIIKNESPKYPASELSVDLKVIEETWFSTNAFCKTILSLLVYQQPKSFDSNGVVILDNSNLKVASSRNFHHFFPKAYLVKINHDFEANWISNITLIDGYSNKHNIGAQAPSVYIGKFLKTNDELEDTLQTHLINDVEAFGILDDDYEKFLNFRAKAITSGLNKKLKSVRNLVETN